jgi:hypothetical protein
MNSTQTKPPKMLVFRTPHPLGGGLNNQILHLTQLLTDSCSNNGTLELPRFLAGDDFFRRAHATHPHSNHSLAFGDIFDIDNFQESVRPCSTTIAGGADAHHTYRTNHTPTLVPINANWFRDAPRMAMVPTVYAALRAGTLVRGPLVRALRLVNEAAPYGKWAAVHLRIERDWDVFCDNRKFSPRRCFPHDEISNITHASRMSATGTVLLYSRDLLHAHTKPRQVRNAFCGRVIDLPGVTAAYAVQAAVQLFVAASASHSFHGNSHSTFSRGVAMLRRGVRSFAYDCAASESIGGLATLNKGQGTKGALRLSGEAGSLCRKPEDCRCTSNRKPDRAWRAPNWAAPQM